MSVEATRLSRTRDDSSRHSSAQAANHGLPKDHLYLLPHGVIYTSASIVTRATSRSSGCILLTAQREPFEVTFGKQTCQQTALAIRPLQERGLRAENCQLVSILVHPTHREYRRFRAITSPGCQPLDRDAYTAVDDLLQSAYLGQLSVRQARELLEKVVAISVRYLPQVRTRDARSELIHKLLQEKWNCQLGDLAQALGVSQDRMSHLFTKVVGLPWRSFQLWQKVSAVGSALGSGRRLAEIAVTAGFSDAAHLSNTWHQAFGAAPSRFFNHNVVQVHYGLRPEIALETAAPAPKKVEHTCPHCGGKLDQAETRRG
jgi:AraC family transcriptional regulator, arabinose operon regulatory protein